MKARGWNLGFFWGVLREGDREIEKKRKKEKKKKGIPVSE